MLPSRDVTHRYIFLRASFQVTSPSPRWRKPAFYPSVKVFFFIVSYYGLEFWRLLFNFVNDISSYLMFSAPLLYYDSRFTPLNKITFYFNIPLQKNCTICSFCDAFAHVTSIDFCSWQSLSVCICRAVVMTGLKCASSAEAYSLSQRVRVWPF